MRTFESEGRVRAVPEHRVTELMLEMLELKPTDKLMEIGTGSGTQTKMWEQYAGEVHTIELHPIETCDYLGKSTYIHAGNGLKGLPEIAPFDAIVATCGVKDIPSAWGDQLKEGGRIVVPIGYPDLQRVTLFKKLRGVLEAVRVGCYARFSLAEDS